MNTTHTPRTSASAVSAYLRRAGFTPIPDRRREGIRVTRSALGAVSVSVSVDLPRQEARLADEVHEALTASTYTVHRDSPTRWTVTR